MLPSWPEINKVIKIDEATYSCPITHDTYRRSAYNAKCSTEVVSTGKNYQDSVSIVPPNHRISALEEIAYYIQEEKKLIAKGNSRREAAKKILQRPIFRKAIYNDMTYPYNASLLTHASVRAPNSGTFGKYKEVHNGKEYTRADFLIGSKIVAEGILMPFDPCGGSIVEWNEALNFPAVVTTTIDETYPTYSVNLYDNSTSFLVDFRYWYGHGRPHLNFGMHSPDAILGYASLRLFEGSLDDVVLPTVEKVS